MPNWCNNNITINCENEVALREFEKKLQEWSSVNYVENDFGLVWLGNIVGNSGIDSCEENSDFSIRCRGRLCYVDEVVDGQLQIQTETAWSPMLKMWVKLCETYLPDAEIIYDSEECGCGLYATNDPVLKDSWIVDIWDTIYSKSGKELDFESDWEADDKYVIEVLQAIFETDCNNINELYRMYEEEDELEMEFSIHKRDFVEIEEWD